MSIGERLRDARQEMGISQKQLCGDTITRNMLSQIENGSATPSMGTLQFLAARLGKPVGYFLEEETASENQTVLREARQAETPEGVLSALENYKAPDSVFDRERYFLEAMACLQGAEIALDRGKTEYARNLLRRCREAGALTPYYTEALRRQNCLLAYRCAPEDAAALEDLLPDLWQELMLRAESAILRQEYSRAATLLDCCEHREERWHLLRGKVYFASGEYESAARVLSSVESADAYSLSEACYRALEDYKRAYEYACKLREITARREREGT